jgi:hypothetical protein
MTDSIEVELASSHFTEVFVEQLIAAIVCIPSHQAGGTASEGLYTLLQSRIGVARRSARAVVSCLATMRLITNVEGVIGRSRLGDKIRREVRAQGSHRLAILIIRSGLMADQIRSLRQVLRRKGDGYVCGRSAAQAAAPQLAGLLGRVPDVEVGGQIAIGRDAGLELDSVWNELHPTSRVDWQDREKRRKAIGDRAELYSLQLERSSHVGALEQINWVSRDDDSFGYDIEVVGSPTRCIEVKGSSGRDVQFLISANEYRVAEQRKGCYEIHFWGEIDLRRDPLDEYDRLRASGYPVCVIDPTVALLAEPWVIEPAQYRVSRRSERYL